jgi:hypothetical protein
LIGWWVIDAKLVMSYVLGHEILIGNVELRRILKGRTCFPLNKYLVDYKMKRGWVLLKFLIEMN